MASIYTYAAPKVDASKKPGEWQKFVIDFQAPKFEGEKEPISTLFHLPPNPNVTYSASLMSKAEETFTSGKSPTPIERTLLTSGLTEAGLQSLAKGKVIETPHLAVKYHVNERSTFARE